jgi:hypothetical protein
MHTVNQQSKVWTTNIQQYLPVNVVINSRLLNVQDYKGLAGSSQQRLAVDPYFQYFIHF